MMILALFAAAAAGAPATEQPMSSARRPVVQATASVRILSGVRVEASSTPQDALVRLVPLESPDGSRRQAKLVEFP
ncbi:MAG TPA: hypothetical protein VFO51_06115 [Sphingomicrobium sp.]|nr:hypothetical protein [Sphingomicrobium sp.]